MLGRRTFTAALALVVLTTLLSACQPARVGARCSTSDFGDDGGDWVLQCRSGRWQRALTKKQAVEIMVAAQSKAPGVTAGTPAANDDYPARLRNVTIDSVFDEFGFPNRQCTSFVAWRLASRNGVRLPVAPGDARLWDDRLAPYAVVNSTPAVGAIAQWNENESYGGLGAGPLGHVGWVQQVNADGTVTIEQYNVGSDGTYLQIHHTRAPRYIHLEDL